MDISPGDSTPTSEASYSHSSTPTTAVTLNNDGSGGIGLIGGPVILANALPRLASHPSTPTSAQLQHFSAPACIGGPTSAAACSTNSSNNNISNCLPMSKLATVKNDDHHHHRMLHTNLPTISPGGVGGGIGLAAVNSNNSMLNHHHNHIIINHGQQQLLAPAPSDLMNPNAPGPPVTLANLPKILSQITGNKSDQSEMNPQKALQTINNALRQQQQQQHQLQHQNSIGIAGDANQLGGNNNSNSLRLVFYFQ